VALSYSFFSSHKLHYSSAGLEKCMEHHDLAPVQCKYCRRAQTLLHSIPASLSPLSFPSTPPSTRSGSRHGVSRMCMRVKSDILLGRSTISLLPSEAVRAVCGELQRKLLRPPSCPKLWPLPSRLACASLPPAPRCGQAIPHWLKSPPFSKPQAPPSRPQLSSSLNLPSSALQAPASGVKLQKTSCAKRSLPTISSVPTPKHPWAANAGQKDITHIVQVGKDYKIISEAE
jgi:hypothetical protein